MHKILEKNLLIKEIFLSIQGESTRAGLSCVFIRLAGCNLDCVWCDTRNARRASVGIELSIKEILNEVSRYNVKLVEVTGGEPLIQPETKKLLKALVAEGYDVLLETNGSISLKGVDKRVVKIIDIKCPSSGHAGSFLLKNLDCMGRQDEIKFVVADRGDYDFAKGFIKKHIRLGKNELIFSPVVGRLKPSILAGWMLKDGIEARLQLQLHKIIWPSGKEGLGKTSFAARAKKKKKREA